MADRYWVGGTDQWNTTAGTKWALTSGGAGGQATPTSSDFVYFDANSGAVTITSVGSCTCSRFDSTGFTGTLAGNGTGILYIYGTVCLISSTLTVGSQFPTVFFNAAGAVTTSFNTNGKSINAVTIGGAGPQTVNLGGPLTATILTLTTGIFAANNHAVSITSFSSSNSNARTLTMGSGTWTIGGSTAITLWSTVTVTNMTLNVSGGTIIFNPSHASGYSIANSSASLTSAVTILAGIAGGRVAISGTWSNLTVNGPNRLLLNGDLTMNGAFNGTPDGIITLESSLATVRTITTTTGITGRNIVVGDVTAAGAGTIVFAPCWDAGGNTGLTCNPGLIKASSRVGMV